MRLQGGPGQRENERRAPRWAVFGDYDWPERRLSYLARLQEMQKLQSRLKRRLRPGLAARREARVRNILVPLREIDAAQKNS